ncbi:MAG TPA: UDP-N-acetylmuramate--L-alanine ligase [Bacteroidia bacterium]|nr:UDP-N-acetylmuramate--L-alanine ligase [Bacteroidia bacterium]HRH07967.1 UDP-N-acetylmuramate--L-alanine ligase [Bacteroidia bacterium]
MDFNTLKTVYFLGIGGIGMSALARYFKTMNIAVCGYDKTPTPLTDELQKEGIQVHFDDSIAYFKGLNSTAKDEVLIIYTPAIPKDHSEYIYFIKEGYTLKKRSEVLGIITQNTFTLAVAGTHGKTTTSSILAHILKSANKDCSAFLGGITRNYNSNFLLSQQLNGPGPTVVEADEYDRSFLTLHPNIAIITSIDADHLDIYSEHKFLKQSFELFSQQIKDGGFLISKIGLDSDFPVTAGVKKYTYSLQQEADFYAKNMRIDNGSYSFDLESKIESISGLHFSFPGQHNTENAIAAVAAAQIFGVTATEIKEALGSFRGVKRRFDYRIKSEQLVFIDDYAHHPEELKACINSVKELYPQKKILGIFQPHLFSRTRDFADEFAHSLDLLDDTILLDIYPARELPIPNVNSTMLLDRMSSSKKMLCSKENLVTAVIQKSPEVILTLGAGDIDKCVEPIEMALLKKYNLKA